LEEHGAELGAEGARGLEEIADILGRVQEALLVGDALGGLEDEGEPLPHLPRPAVEERKSRHPIEGVVDLDGGEPLRVEAEHVRLLKLRGVEAALPLLVTVAARAHPDAHEASRVVER
jgi:hypothetical protein